MSSDIPTLLSILNKTKEYLKNKNVLDAKLSAELLLAHVLKCKRLDLYLRFEDILSEDMLNTLRPLVKRRGGREPLQYVIGEAPFGDMLLKVAPGVLIPRPETEELCELIVNQHKGLNSILDLGTGSGAIALFLANAYPEAQVIAVDASPEALTIAQENAKRYQLSERVKFIESNWFDKVEGSFDLIVSNPPYLTEEEWRQSEKEVKGHEPYNALVPQSNDPEGIGDLLIIMKDALNYLSKGGTLIMETGIAQHEHLAETAEALGYIHWESLEDLSGRKRFFKAGVMG